MIELARWPDARRSALRGARLAVAAMLIAMMWTPSEAAAQTVRLA